MVLQRRFQTFVINNSNRKHQLMTNHYQVVGKFDLINMAEGIMLIIIHVVREYLVQLIQICINDIQAHTYLIYIRYWEKPTPLPPGWEVIYCRFSETIE